MIVDDKMGGRRASYPPYDSRYREKPAPQPVIVTNRGRVIEYQKPGTWPGKNGDIRFLPVIAN